MTLTTAEVLDDLYLEHQFIIQGIPYDHYSGKYAVTFTVTDWLDGHGEKSFYVAKDTFGNSWVVVGYRDTPISNGIIEFDKIALFQQVF